MVDPIRQKVNQLRSLLDRLPEPPTDRCGMMLLLTATSLVSNYGIAKDLQENGLRLPSPPVTFVVGLFGFMAGVYSAIHGGAEIFPYLILTHGLPGGFIKTLHDTINICSGPNSSDNAKRLKDLKPNNRNDSAKKVSPDYGDLAFLGGVLLIVLGAGLLLKGRGAPAIRECETAGVSLLARAAVF